MVIVHIIGGGDREAMGNALAGTVLENMKTHRNQTLHYVMGKGIATSRISRAYEHIRLRGKEN